MTRRGNERVDRESRNRWVALALVLSGACVSILALGAADAPQDGAPVPVIRFESTTHDFGRIPSDRKVAHRWVFHNDGTAPLEIVATRPSCGCTVSVVQQSSIPPGESGALALEFDPAGQQGPVRKSLAVVSNDPVRPSVLLTIRAEVTSVDVPEVAGGHPPIAGQSLLSSSCAGCHAAPAAGKSDEPLYASVCAMCHGPKAEGGTAPTLRAGSYLGSRTDADLVTAIAYGTANPRMPGFSEQMGGPLSQAQIASLVALLRAWGPLAESPTAPPVAREPAGKPPGGR